jgi:hypothetical protein
MLIKNFKTFPVHAIKASGRRTMMPGKKPKNFYTTGIAPFILNLCSRLGRVLNFKQQLL